MSATSAASDISTCRLSDNNNNANDWGCLVPGSNPVTKASPCVRDSALGERLRRQNRESRTNSLINLPRVPPLEHPSSKPSGVGNEWFCDPNKTVIYYKHGTRVHHHHRMKTANPELQESKFRLLTNRHLKPYNFTEVMAGNEIPNVKPVTPEGTTAMGSILDATTMTRQEELEVSLCQINRLNAERNKCTQQLEEVQTVREELEHKLEVTAQRHQKELKQLQSNKEFMELKQAHCKELKDSVHEMKMAKRQALTEMKLCYVERIDALQESLSLCTKENNAFKDKLFQLEYHHQQQQQQQKERQQKQLEHKHSQTAQLGNEFGDQWIQKMCETVRAEFGDWDRENCGLWEARFAELRNEADCAADKLRAELQTEQEAVYRAKEETNQILKKIALAEVYQALDTRKLLDEKLQHFHTRCDEQLEKERADLRDQLQQALYHAFNQIDKWMRDWAESVECTIQIIKAAERATTDGMASKMKEMRLEELGRTTSAQCAFRFDSNLSDTDWKKGLVSDFLNQLQDCLGSQLRSTLDRLLTEYHTAVDHVRERAECEVTESKKKYEAELERCHQNQLQVIHL
ncbi:hypothetical protein PHET_04031 [Paragonimus heterotremus]|uniref:Uncharacterized protein n=1 Tax=Paragonimus heterotremus TaxID=100268 RepID=A0A8J4TM60_9TREM|nr:hypothetical protein PHET_04031 [Paragonimus heterotremus]